MNSKNILRKMHIPFCVFKILLKYKGHFHFLNESYKNFSAFKVLYLPNFDNATNKYVIEVFMNNINQFEVEVTKININRGTIGSARILNKKEAQTFIFNYFPILYKYLEKGL